MNAEAALEKQIEMYRQMTGEQRLKIALNLYELSSEMTREGIRHQFPGISEEEVNARLRERIVEGDWLIVQKRRRDAALQDLAEKDLALAILNRENLSRGDK